MPASPQIRTAGVIRPSPTGEESWGARLPLPEGEGEREREVVPIATERGRSAIIGVELGGARGGASCVDHRCGAQESVRESETG